MRCSAVRRALLAQGGFTVPRDFVEAPSQMLENWVWDKSVLDTFAADYRDQSKKIPSDTIKALLAARQATDGYFNRRQLAIGLLDLKLHTLSADEAWLADVAQLTNKVTGDVTIPTPENTAWAAYIGHLAGYDAGYYGYLWAKVMAIDMASEFTKAPGGFLMRKSGADSAMKFTAQATPGTSASRWKNFWAVPGRSNRFLITSASGSELGTEDNDSGIVALSGEEFSISLNHKGHELIFARCAA